MKVIILLLFLPFFPGCDPNQAGKNSTLNKPGQDTATDTYTVTAEDASMNSAIAQAKKTIDEFDRALKTNSPSYSDFAVKKKYMTPDGGGEHMWIACITILNGNYKGFINNDAEQTTEVKYGDTVIISKDEITDWMYLENNILRGGYTIREVRNRLNKEERIKMDRDMGFKIEDR